LKKFDVQAYITRRIRILRGEVPQPGDIDEITQYTRRRMREIAKYGDDQPGVDMSPLACYTLSTMGDRDGET